MSFLFRHKTDLTDPADALPGRESRPFVVPDTHFVLGTPLEPPFPEGTERAIFGMGCFWGAERGFWEGHDPTQGMRQGNDVGTQYRSAIYVTSEAQREAALASRDRYQERLGEAGHGEITTEISDAPQFFYAEDYHQEYLAKVPNGYCGLGGTGVSCPVGAVGA